MSWTVDPEAPKYWEEWRQRCAARRCSESGLRYFEQFAYRRFRRAFQSLYKENFIDEMAASGAAWHEFEVFHIATKRKTGVRYKDHLLNEIGRGGDPIARKEAIEKYATACFKELARKYIKHSGILSATTKASQPQILSMSEQPEDGHRDGKALNIGELLPKEMPMEQSDEEWLPLVNEIVDTVFAKMAEAERFLLIGILTGTSLIAPIWKDMPGYSRDRRYKLRNSLAEGGWFVGELRAQLQAAYPREPEEELAFALEVCKRQLIERVKKWAEQEKRCKGFFKG